ncbi:baseplate J/gp47 family protein [Xenorhabdus bovienii]|uniref:baseplate J/gp47 family protein n=2 Tax=Xenorhabdus bovienii TaxID=40576 RepID=UPI00237C8E86|nr:baseplate J/gp47 family protein [Xenorhabdus bovienii]MDE1487693.1 baseplate J/gp47 family protein [Xenorhabdus bovienii]MDE9478545.1 baseplate J/gp47 family protein [Xenorhabdus bovienii]MDE9531432.1 baseplate J/gp47 family protein [Xenorhabdus bovienii]
MADYHYITRQGVIVPDTADLRRDVENDFYAAFGQDIDLSPETPQGVLVTMETENRDAMVRNNAELANQINPDIAGGLFLDAIWALMGGHRFAATHSYLANVEFGGVPDTLIPKGAQAESVTGALFETTSTLIIGKEGKTTGDMRAVALGSVECKAGHLERVASSVLGWETVNNPTHAIVGREAESDVSARRRRKQTLAKNTVSVGEAITASLYELEGVNSLSYRENYTPQILKVDGMKLLPHSVYVCVEGGDREEIARALLRTKTVGAAYNGQEVIKVIERVSGQEYEIRFDRPSEKVIFCRVTVKKSTMDAQSLIPAAIEQWVRGELEGDNGLVVGREVSPFEISAAINSIEPRLFITKVELSLDGLSWEMGTIPIKLNEVARLHRGSVQVVIV